MLAKEREGELAVQTALAVRVALAALVTLAILAAQVALVYLTTHRLDAKCDPPDEGSDYHLWADDVGSSLLARNLMHTVQEDVPISEPTANQHAFVLIRNALSTTAREVSTLRRCRVTRSIDGTTSKIVTARVTKSGLGHCTSSYGRLASAVENPCREVWRRMLFFKLLVTHGHHFDPIDIATIRPTRSSTRLQPSWRTRSMIRLAGTKRILIATHRCLAYLLV